jgi:hypothetical protein
LNIKRQKNILIQELLRQLGPVPLLQEAVFLPHQAVAFLPHQEAAFLPHQEAAFLPHQEAAFLPHQEAVANHAELSAEGIAVQHDVADTPDANFFITLL